MSRSSPREVARAHVSSWRQRVTLTLCAGAGCADTAVGSRDVSRECRVVTSPETRVTQSLTRRRPRPPRRTVLRSSHAVWLISPTALLCYDYSLCITGHHSANAWLERTPRLPIDGDHTRRQLVLLAVELTSSKPSPLRGEQDLWMHDSRLVGRAPPPPQ